MKGKDKKRGAPAEPASDSTDALSVKPGTKKRVKPARTGTESDQPSAAPASADGQASETQDTVEDVTALKDRLLRLQADFENFRKRTLREKTTIYQQANEALLLQLLPVFDHLDLALESVQSDKNGEAFVDGVRLVRQQALSALTKFGLTVVEAEGRPFDPNCHEAISHLPSDEVAENMVMTQIRRGYVLGGKLLRAAQVVVSKGPAAGPSEAGEEAGS